MKYKIEDVDGTFDVQITKNFGDGRYLIKINDAEYSLKVININAKNVEFILNNTYHKTRYLKNASRQMDLLVDGVPLNVKLHTNLDEIVYKNSGGGGASDSQQALHSPIPGKVVSIAVKEGDTVNQGDTICMLESMKMQVGIKAHKSGTIKSIKVKEGLNLAKNDIITEIE